jgi:DNA (cytosine-5)-methyltransferase 1
VRSSRRNVSGTPAVVEARHQFSVAELFCGCGGLSHGFARSGNFRVVFGNDIKKAALRTFVHNHSRNQMAPEIIEGDIRVISTRQIEEALTRQGVTPGTLDCLIGGPPCQGFSQLRRSQERLDDGLVRFKGYNKLDEDPRNELVVRFLEIANALRPKIVLIENVPQMLRHGHKGVLGGLASSVKAMLQEMGYRVVVGIVNSADYGVPQLRERSFFLASRVGELELPKATYGDPSEVGFKSRLLQPWTTVEDALKDLPAEAPKRDVLGGGSCSLYPPGRLSRYARLMRSTGQFPFNHLTRAYSQRIINIVHHMKPGETWDSASARMQTRYETLITKLQREKEIDRKTAKANLIREGLINPVFYRKYYWSAYTRLAWDRPALTITANCNFLGSGRFTHPEQDRGITMREAARLQSFEDDFRFLTSADGADTISIGVGMDMIGEAVPPLVGEAFGRQVAAKLADALFGADNAREDAAIPPLGRRSA